MALLNEYNKKKWRSDTQSEAILAATIARNLTISAANVVNYGPFTRLHIENKSAVVIFVDLNGTALGDNTVANSSHRTFLRPNFVMDIIPEEDQDKIFYKVAITNSDAAVATVAGDIVWSYGNY